MDAWIDIRRKARACHQAALSHTNGDRTAKALIDAAIKADDLKIRYVEEGKTFGPGVYGLLERANGLVNVLKGQNPEDEAVVIAHEIGHFHLHRDSTQEVTRRQHGLGGDPLEAGSGKVEGYSPNERKEVQADIFAGEFLCPSDWLREQFLAHNKRPADIAKELGIPHSLVVAQTSRALLLPPLSPEPEKDEAPRALGLDESQKKAAHWKGNVLVDAGPGTGKTRTLIARVEHLLTSVGPTSILALTFSNRAAEEMRERLSIMNPEAAIEIWAGTFHAFGWELIQKWPVAVNRTTKVRMLDEAGQLTLLEEHLDELPLRYYQNLYEPAYELVNILRAISRCKDECILPDEYIAEAKAALEIAANDEEREAAEKAIEVGEVYAIYEKALEKVNAVDFGDLINLAATLIEKNPAVKSYVSSFKHVLVDEYQDVNFASARLLRAICAAGAEAWVVADLRQSIYRFRGAAPANVERFGQEFGGEYHSLKTNYRSFAPIVRTFQRFSAAMGSGSKGGDWTAERAAGGGVTLTVAPTVAAEAEAIHENIEQLRARGVRYSDQAILARTHLTLFRITEILEQLGVPLVYLGDLFERDEIRTLLSLVSIDAEHGGIGLMRMATLSEYGASRDDALAVIGWTRANRVAIMEALTRIDEISGLSPVGKAGLKRLGSELIGMSKASPWTLLTTWLFERSDHLKPLLQANSALSQQKLIAIYHLLKFCGEQASAGQNSRKAFLDRIRRLEALNQDNSFRRVASEATDIDAIRVMTIHGSKGLEFRAVHLPALATRYMPTTRQGNRCPPPANLAHAGSQASDHEAEEESLFFVGLSRARDFLFLSRAEKYTSTNASPSKFIPAIQGAVSHKSFNGSGTVYASTLPLLPPPPAAEYSERDLETYMKCPARYRYMVIEGLRGGRDDSAYVSFHRCVYATVRWLEMEREKGAIVPLADALARLSAEWKQAELEEHPFEPYYRRAAEEMVRSMVNAIATESGTYEREEWKISVGKHHIKLMPDRVLLTPEGTVRVQRIRTGRQTKSEPDKPIYPLLRRGASQRYPSRPTRVEIFYLASGTAIPTIAKNDDKGVGKYADAIAAIEQGKFQPTPEARTCPNCPCYFICRA